MRKAAHGFHKIFVKAMHALVHRAVMTTITKKLMGTH
jgi:hypothetical protein